MPEPQRLSIRLPHPDCKAALQAHAKHHGINLNQLMQEAALYLLMHTKSTRPFGRGLDRLTKDEKYNLAGKVSGAVIGNEGLNPKPGGNSFQSMLERNALELKDDEQTSVYEGAFRDLLGEDNQS